MNKTVVATGRTYHGRYTWTPWGNDGAAATLGYCFVNGKGREYLRNYRLVTAAAVRELKAKGVRLVALPYKKSEDPRKLVFARRFLKPLRTYWETETHILFLKDI